MRALFGATRVRLKQVHAFQVNDKNESTTWLPALGSFADYVGARGFTLHSQKSILVSKVVSPKSDIVVWGSTLVIASEKNKINLFLIPNYVDANVVSPQIPIIRGVEETMNTLKRLQSSGVKASYRDTALIKLALHYLPDVVLGTVDVPRVMESISSLYDKQTEVEWCSNKAYQYRIAMHEMLPSLYNEIQEAGLEGDDSAITKYIANHAVFRFESQVPVVSSPNDVMRKQNEDKSPSFEVNVKLQPKTSNESKKTLSQFLGNGVIQQVSKGYQILGELGTADCEYKCGYCNISDLTSIELLSHSRTSSHVTSSLEDNLLPEVLRIDAQLGWSQIEDEPGSNTAE